MSVGSPRRKALILSPSASHPQDHGNRHRVLQTTSHFKNLGYEIYFVLYPQETDWRYEVPPAANEMREAWTSFAVIPPSIPLHALADGEHHLIDDWWDPQTGLYLKWLFARETFDIFVVNYTFLSKAFEFAPKQTVKVLETHDRLSGRKELFASFGVPPEFFYTTPEQERVALDRADVVVAIKDAEAEFFRGLTTRDVVSLPFFSTLTRPMNPRPERARPGECLRVGFIGALNAVNAINMQKFLDEFAKYERIYTPNINIIVAGNVCSRLRTNSANVTLAGRVESPENYYGSVDVIVAPMIFSTGIKIKIGEALSYGKPVVATCNGFDGFPALDEFHALDDMAGVCRALIKLSFDRERLSLLEMRTSMAAKLARRRCDDGFAALTQAIVHKSKLILFMTDQEIWKAETIRQERLTQWCELCTYMARIIVIYMGTATPEKFTRHGHRLNQLADIVPTAGDADAAAEILDELSKSHTILDLVISADGEMGAAVLERFSGRVRNITIDQWALTRSARAGADDPAQCDLWICDASASSEGRKGVPLNATAFRYLPDRLSALRKRPSAPRTAVMLCDPDEFDRLGIERLRSEAAIESSIVIVDVLGERESGFFELLSSCGVPDIIVAVGRDRRSVEVCRCLAGYWKIEYIHVSSADFPCVVGGGDQATLCMAFSDLVDYLSSAATGDGNASAHSGDAGWSTYWRQLAHREQFGNPASISARGAAI